MTQFRLETYGVPGEYVAIQAVLSLRSSAALCQWWSSTRQLLPRLHGMRRGGAQRASSCSGACSSGGVHCTVSCSDRSFCASDGAHRASSYNDRSTCASGGANRTSSCCACSTCAGVELITPAPAVIAARAPVVEHIGPAPAVTPAPPKLRVLWHAGLVEIVAHVIVADVDEYWLHDHTRYLQPLRTEAVEWILPPSIIRERSPAMGLDYFFSPRVGFYLVLPDLNWTDLDESGGHCAAEQRGSWEAFVNPLMARTQLFTFAPKGYRLACCTMDPRGPLSQRSSWLPLRASARVHTPAFNFKSCSSLG